MIFYVTGQLDTLQAENHHLKCLLQSLESHSHEVCVLCCSRYTLYTLTRPTRLFNILSPQTPPSASPREVFVSFLGSLEQENQQLRQELAEMHRGHEVSDHTCKEGDDQVLLSHTTTDQPQSAGGRCMAITH